MVEPRAGMLLPAPFVAWLERRIGQSSISAVARRVGVTDRAVRRLIVFEPDRTESGLLRVDLVDRWLTAFGDRLADVYGNLLPLAEDWDWRGGVCEGCGEHMREPAELCGFCELELERVAA